MHLELPSAWGSRASRRLQLLAPSPTDSYHLCPSATVAPRSPFSNVSLPVSSPSLPFLASWGQRKSPQPALALWGPLRCPSHSFKYELFIRISSPWVCTRLRDPLHPATVFPLPASTNVSASTSMVRPLALPLQQLQMSFHLGHLPPGTLQTRDSPISGKSSSKTLVLTSQQSPSFLLSPPYLLNAPIQKRFLCFLTVPRYLMHQNLLACLPQVWALNQLFQQGPRSYSCLPQPPSPA